jgi:hypothetical protein
MTEKTWVHELVPRLANELRGFEPSEIKVAVSDSSKLAYSCVIHEYDENGMNKPESSKYETDLLVYDTLADGRWTPRLVVECKIGGGVSTHDALTYSSKAATHKQVHPYLRYGFLAGEREHHAIPVRLVKHGAYFDFMATWRAAEPTEIEWQEFCGVVKEEVKASRAIQELLKTHRSTARKKYHILHRRLVLK